MSILIKGMEMPKSCYECVLNHSFFRDLECHKLEGMSEFGKLPHTEDRHKDCPLVFVPPHGRLIDTDAIVGVQMYDDEHEDWIFREMTVEDYLGMCDNEVPTVCPADGNGTVAVVEKENK